MNAIWYCVRQGGAAKRHGWTRDVALDDLPRRVGAGRGDLVEVCVAGGFRPVAPARHARVFRRRDRGIVGLEIACREDVARLAPTRMIAANLGFTRAIEKYLREWNAGLDEFTANGRLRTFSARQFLLSGDDGERTELFRGSTLVAPVPEVGENRAADLAGGIGRWMLRNLSAEGRLPYKYWPSRGVESPADNAIRRFLASLSLARLGEHRGDAAIREAAVRNLRFNLTRYFQTIGDGRGAIVEPAGAKLGAAALAALSILESPARDEFTTELAMLTAGVNSLADDELGFRTFFFPPERDGENWNFYSGEALLFWAESRRRGALGAPSLERCAATFARCRERHFRARNPAFVPWHAQACASLFAQTGRREFAESRSATGCCRSNGTGCRRMRPAAAGVRPAACGFDRIRGGSRTPWPGARWETVVAPLAYETDFVRFAAVPGPHDTFYISRKDRVLGALRRTNADGWTRPRMPWPAAG